MFVNLTLGVFRVWIAKFTPLVFIIDRCIYIARV